MIEHGAYLTIIVHFMTKVLPTPGDGYGGVHGIYVIGRTGTNHNDYLHVRSKTLLVTQRG